MGNICERDDKTQANPITGLTDKDVQNLQKSFSPIYSKAYKNGFELFSRVLKAEPELKTSFKFLKGEDEAQYEYNHQIRALTVLLMTALNTIIQNLNHPEVVIAMLHWLGDLHKSHKVPKKFFVVQRAVMEDFLKNDRKLSDPVLASWEQFADFTFPHVFSKMNH